MRRDREEIHDRRILRTRGGVEVVFVGAPGHAAAVGSDLELDVIAVSASGARELLSRNGKAGAPGRPRRRRK